MIDRIIGIIAPHRCCSCGETGTLLCESCKNYVLEEPFEQCALCCRPCGQKGLCQTCARRVPVEQAWCVGERRDVLKRLLDAYKFDSSREAVNTCVDLLDAVMPQLTPDVVLCGIPSSPPTIRSRGFDHIGMIVERLAKKRGVTAKPLLVRDNPTTLHFLSRKERQKIGPSLFKAADLHMPESVVIIDDIITTGTTIAAASSVLRRAGVRHIYVAVIAHQPRSE